MQAPFGCFGGRRPRLGGIQPTQQFQIVREEFCEVYELQTLDLLNNIPRDRGHPTSSTKGATEERPDLEGSTVPPPPAGEVVPPDTFTGWVVLSEPFAGGVTLSPSPGGVSINGTSGSTGGGSEGGGSVYR